jgi:hypothetical protein
MGSLRLFVKSSCFYDTIIIIAWQKIWTFFIRLTKVAALRSGAVIAVLYSETVLAIIIAGGTLYPYIT